MPFPHAPNRDPNPLPPLTDPLAAAAALAAGARPPYVVYERDGCWTVASGARAELRMDRSRIVLRTSDGERELPAGPDPLRRVAELLGGLSAPWRAHGWAAFELAFLLQGDPDAAGDGDLLHLVVADEQVDLAPSGVTVSAGTPARRDAIVDRIATLSAPIPAPDRVPVDVGEAGAQDYRQAVAGAVRDIRDGLLQKVILSRVVPVPDELDMVATYVAGRRGNTPARSFVLDVGGLRATGFSPETVVEVDGDGWVRTQPLAGTRARLGDAPSDLARRMELLGDPKEVFEHAISVRLAQDELGGVCRSGSVRVDEFMTISERGSVQHLASRVSGRLDAGRDAWHAFGTLFPAITASGIPKRAACALAARVETEPRGLYSGAVLQVDSTGALDAALVLRTVFARDGRTWMRAGAGVVAMSTPDRELEETCEKLRSVSAFLVPAVPASRPPGDPDVHPERPAPDLSVAGLRATAAELTEEEPDGIAPDANLFELGVESIALMQLVSTWRRAGIEVDFAELAQNPTLDGWSKLLAERGPAAPGTTVASPQADPAPDGETFPLAVLQHAYWVGRTPGRLGGVAAHLYTEFDRDTGAAIDPARLREALDRLVARHDMLRVVVTDNGRQRVAERSGWRGLTVHDLRGAGDGECDAEVARLRDRHSHQMLDIEAGEVFSTDLVLLPGGRTRLQVDVDMVAADAVSYRILLADLARLYADPDADLPALEYDYRRYREARPGVREQAARRAAEWWAERLPTLPGAPELPMSATGDPTGRVARRQVWLSPQQRSALAGHARRNGLTVAMVVATAFAEMLGAWSAQSRFLLNVPLFDREPVHPDVEHVVGDFTGSVLLEIDLTASLPFAERAAAVQARMHADAAHADHTGVEVLRDLTRARGEQVLAPVVFTSALNLGELFDAGVRTHFGDPVWIVSQGPQVMLDAQVTELDGGLLVNWDAREGEFAPGVVDAMFAAFADLVRGLCSDAGRWGRPVGALLPADRTAVRAPDPDPLPRRAPRLHDAFFARAVTDPAGPAVVGEGTTTHGELASRALRVAAALRERGVRPGDPVGITLAPGVDQVVAVLGVLAAGGCYVPVGIEQPAARADRIARLAGFAVRIAADPGPGVLTLADADAPGPSGPLDAPLPGDPEDLAYILFTSGSTGEPKGVEVPHRAATATVDDLVDRFALGPGDRTLALSALDFDLSVFDVFAPLSVGGAVVTVPDADRRDAATWAGMIAGHRVTVLNCVPALLDMALASGVDLGPALRLVLLGGDRVGTDLPARLALAAPGARFVALGGTTETAIHSTVLEIRDGPVPADWTCVPYGVGLRGVALRVVDPLGRDCPDHVPGELWIGGEGVARGYRGDPERTADRFVVHDGLRWYRTGDLARYRPDGPGAIVEFLGRRDDQVKLRGFRVEPGEIEAALVADDAVRSAAAVVLPSRGGGTLVAAVVADGTAADGTDLDAVRERLRAVLPPHMIPERLLALDALPLSANGKVDRRAVRAAVDVAGPVEAGPAPDGPVQRLVAHVWSEVLGAPMSDVHEPFFAAGGDSVLATAVVAQLREALDTRAVSVRTLFATPTVAGLAAALAAADPDPGRPDELAELYLEVAALSDDEVAARLGAS